MPTSDELELGPFSPPLITSKTPGFEQGEALEANDIFESIYKNHGLPLALRAAAAVPQALSDTAGSMANSAYNALTLPRDAYEGRIDPTSAEGVARSANLAMTLGVGGRSFAEPNSAGIFGGELARHPPAGDISILGEKPTPDEIWGQTGWFQGPEGRWRFEISDKDSKLDPRAFLEKKANGEQTTVGDILDHPDLYKQYPEVANMPLHVADIKKYYGFYDPNSTSITLASDLNQQEFHSTLLHEIQHYVQDREGHAFGAAPESKEVQQFVGPQRAQLSDIQGRLGQIYKAIDQWLGHEGYPTLQDSGGGDLAKKFDIQMPFFLHNQDLGERIIDMENRESQARVALQKAQSDVYRRFAGEVESRNVQERFENPEFHQYSPRSTEDVPRNMQIIRTLPPRGPST